MQQIVEDPDLSLVEGMARKEGDALEELYRRRGPQILSYLERRLSDHGLAEEVLQDVMLAAWNHAPRFRGECRVYTWLLSIARNRAINAFHRQRPSATSLLSIEEPEPGKIGIISQDIEKIGSYDDIHLAILGLSEDQREILDLVFYHGLSMEETALVLHITSGTVKSRLHRAKARLRGMVEKIESDR